MFSRHYHSELSFLRELGRGFAQANPSTAGMLGERGGDPDAERLLEGVAFLTARIRERLDDEVPEVIHELCDLVLPHYLRPLPACSILELSPQVSALRGRQRIPAGVEVAAEPIDGTSCRFRTTLPLDFLPLTLQDASLEGPQSSAPVLRLRFLTTKPGREHVFHPDGIRLYLHDEFPVATTLRLWLLRHCRDVQVRGLGGDGPSVSLGPGAVAPVGLRPEHGMLPWPRTAPEGYRLLQEYFTLPQKFLFLDVLGLERARSIADDRFELVFTFDRPPELPGRVSSESFRLHCVPIINLFSASAEPIRGGLPGTEHLLRPSGLPAPHAEVYSVDAVRGVPLGTAERTRYVPFFGFEHAARPEARLPFFRIRRELSPAGDGLDAYLSVGTPRDVAPSLAEEVLSVDLTCTNRALAGRVRAGDVSLPTPSSPTGARFRNIQAASKPVLPPLGTELHWRLIALLALGHRSLQETEALRSVLSLYSFQSSSETQAARANRNRIDALQVVEAAPARRLIEGTPIRGVRTTIELQEASFASAGEGFLLGSILDELFATRVTLNSFSELRLRLQPSRTEYTWAPRNGCQVLV